MTSPIERDQFDNIILPDGSFIHRSKKLKDRAVVALDRWFLWICTKPGLPGVGAQGYILMDDSGIVYFAGQQQGQVSALKKYREVKGK